jgi:hypothetical protein
MSMQTRGCYVQVEKQKLQGVTRDNSELRQQLREQKRATKAAEAAQAAQTTATATAEAAQAAAEQRVCCTIYSAVATEVVCLCCQIHTCG